MIPIDHVATSVFEIPTEVSESDGTLEWTRTTLVVAEVSAGGQTGFGYTYGARVVADLIRKKLGPKLAGLDALAIPLAYERMIRALRNVGRAGIGMHAVSALDLALWDLKGKLLSVPVVTLLGAERESVPVYGSGGFTSYAVPRLQRQLAGWIGEGISRVKMKVGRDPAHDEERVRAAREAVGEDAELMVDANGAYARKQALGLGERFADEGVSWFEEPVSSDDLEGLRLLRDRLPGFMAVAAGEYGYVPAHFKGFLDAGAVDVLQADATRCGGITGFLRVAALCDAWNLPLSSHTAPSAHLHVCCAAPRVAHLEWFHDHVLIERALFEGAVAPKDGSLRPDTSRPGLGIELRRKDAVRYAA
jgi:L-alanine-DL-glutamate epimerase-like enolase superfamily enzyme